MARTLTDTLDDFRAYLSSPEGRAVRARIATIVVIGVPIVAELPGIRKTRMGRILQIASVAGLVIKGAEWLRDWEPNHGSA